MFRCQQILVFLTLLFTKAQPRFEVFWESSVSYQYVDEKQYNPWYINIGDFDTGGLGYIGGPNAQQQQLLQQLTSQQQPSLQRPSLLQPSQQRPSQRQLSL